MEIKNGEWIKQARIRAGYSQVDFAEAVGVTPSAILQYEKGSIIPRPEKFERILQVLRLSLPALSVASEEIIEELHRDIEEFGEDEPCAVFYGTVGSSLIFTNYDFIVEESPISKDELTSKERMIVTTLGNALELFEYQDRII